MKEKYPNLEFNDFEELLEFYEKANETFIALKLKLEKFIEEKNEEELKVYS